MLRRPAGRRVASAAIVLFWVLMTALLVRREYLVPEWRGAAQGLPIATAPSDDWFGIYLPWGERAGVVHWSSRPAERNGNQGMELRLRARGRLPIPGLEGELAVEGVAWVVAQRGLSEFDFSARSSGRTMRAEGVVEDNVLSAEIDTGAGPAPLRVPVGNAVMMLGELGGGYSAPLLDVGEEVVVDSFDPVTLGAQRVRVTCVAKETVSVLGFPIAARKLVADANGLETTLWVGPTGEVLQVRTPVGLTIKKIPEEEAEAALAESESGPKEIAPER